MVEQRAAHQEPEERAGEKRTDLGPGPWYPAFGGQGGISAGDT